MGRVAGSFGIKGWLRVMTYTEQPDALARFPAWWICREGCWSEVKVLESASHAGHLAVRIEGCETREQAAAWRGAEVAVERAELPPPGPGEYYWADLEGLAVVNERGESLGQVVEMFSNGAQDILRTREAGGVEGREHLIPFIPPVVRSVALDAGLIEVAWERDW